VEAPPEERVVPLGFDIQPPPILDPLKFAVHRFGFMVGRFRPMFHVIAGANTSPAGLRF
jgi:hypothetical protein